MDKVGRMNDGFLTRWLDNSIEFIWNLGLISFGTLYLFRSSPTPPPSRDSQNYGNKASRHWTKTWEISWRLRNQNNEDVW